MTTTKTIIPPDEGTLGAEQAPYLTPKAWAALALRDRLEQARRHEQAVLRLRRER